ncbi:hypothetical protein LSAT2_018002 [Lamellibrachia satsuma]|nr:hypothetical protein LSAT2_018002 [Lamellibrachia satsuma]
MGDSSATRVRLESDSTATRVNPYDSRQQDGHFFLEISRCGRVRQVADIDANRKLQPASSHLRGSRPGGRNSDFLRNPVPEKRLRPECDYRSVSPVVPSRTRRWSPASERRTKLPNDVSVALKHQEENDRWSASANGMSCSAKKYPKRVSTREVGGRAKNVPTARVPDTLVQGSRGVLL